MSEEKVVVKNGVHNYSEAENYVSPKEPEVQEHLEWFMGLKLGIMMHWSPGSQMSSYESWPLCDEAGDWSQEDITWTDVKEAQQQYKDMNRTFNPIKFRPDKWARLAKECGFKYLLCTTKHHDGFCMYDTKTTDYRITHESCPFHTNARADIIGNLYDAFRKEGLAISVYFSKIDWHSEYFWSPEFKDHSSALINYDAADHPEIWDKFVDYTHRQILELTSNYGKVDVLWLDGGGCRPENRHMDIHLSELVKKIRSTTQPHLIVCDRTVGGENENIITPEQNVPESPLGVPWESCMTVGRCFSFHYNDIPKPPRVLVHTLIDIVAKGGNLALNITPQPDGELPAPMVESLLEMGSWLKVNGEGIYETKICAPYVTGRDIKISYTQKNDNIYIFYSYSELQHYRLPREIVAEVGKKVKEITLLRTDEGVPFVQNGSKLIMETGNLSMFEVKYADCFCLTLM